MNLSEIKSGHSARIVDVLVQGDSKIRICQMGITKGCTVSVIKKAPLGDPIELSCRGYRVCLRGKEAKRIKVEAIDE